MPDLKRALGVPGLAFYGVGLILGAGIYAIIGPAAGIAGQALWMAFMLGAVAAFLTGLSYAELATMYPKAGAEYVYLRHALPGKRWAAAMAGVALAAGAIASAAVVAIAFAGYAQHFVSWPNLLLAGALLVAVTAINLWGIRESSYANMAMTLLEAGGLAVFIYLGLQEPGFGGALFHMPESLGAILGAAGLVFFAYLGFEDIANLAEEAEDPGSDIPKAIFIALGVTTLIYLMVSLAAVVLATPETLAATDAPLATAIQEEAPWFVGILSGIALFATANTALISLLTASRLLYGISDGGDLPSPVSWTLPERKTPWVATLVSLAGAAVLLPFGGLRVVGGVSSFAALLGFAAVNATLILLRFRRPDAERPFRVPVNVGKVNVPAALGVVAALGLTLRFDRKVYMAGAAALGLGALAYVTRDMWGGEEGREDGEGGAGGAEGGGDEEGDEGGSTFRKEVTRREVTERDGEKVTKATHVEVSKRVTREGGQEGEDADSEEGEGSAQEEGEEEKEQGGKGEGEGVGPKRMGEP